MRRREYRAMADINVTNLVDVVLVLLIIFMISAPLLQSGIEVDLPKTKTATLDEQAEGVVLTIDRKGGIFINDVWTKVDNFEQALKNELKKEDRSSVYLRGDSLVPYGVVVNIIGRLKAAGVDNLGLITNKEEANKIKKK
jgi:biopolymer transport protein TolR